MQRFAECARSRLRDLSQQTRSMWYGSTGTQHGELKCFVELKCCVEDLHLQRKLGFRRCHNNNSAVLQVIVNVCVTVVLVLVSFKAWSHTNRANKP